MARSLHIAAAALGALLSALGPALAAERHYQPAMESAHWTTKGTPLRCSLSQTIPGYGRAVFSKSAGEPLAFKLTVRRRPTAGGRARLRSVPPPWRHDARVHELGLVAYGTSSAPFHFSGNKPRVMMAELERGMFPTVSYRDRLAPDGAISVSVSAVNFQAPMRRFLHCTTKLLPFNFGEIRHSTVHFATGRSRLDHAAKQRLNVIAEYMRLDPSIESATIDGFTDSQGTPRDNYLLSQRRALAVRNYLRGARVARSRLHIRFYGQAHPVRSNKTAGGRAANRRVHVTLSR